MKKVHFETTKGEIVAELFEDERRARWTNFVGLVTGTKEWVDPKTRREGEEAVLRRASVSTA